MSEPHPVTLAVRALGSLDVEGLRAEWRRRYGAPPGLKAPAHLRLLLAWRMQVEVWGGLDVDTRRKLTAKTPVQRGPELHPGAKLAREWRGVRHEVELAEGGVLYGGRTYASLSEVARQITGVRWNGPSFFGLRTGS